MAGQYLQIGGRLTYVPPFVNERFDGPPFWACTFTALLNGANVGWLGQKPATHAEVAALAGASGDANTRGGSRSSHMIAAVRVRYRQSVALDNVSVERAQERLASGWALVAGVTYGELPQQYRRWSPRFKLGHRVTVLGWSGGRTRLLDPLAAKNSSYAGEWISWSDFAQAWWRDEQLWFQEGQFVAGPAAAKAVAKPATGVDATAARVLQRFETPRHFRIAPETTVVAFSPGRPPIVARRMRFSHPSGANFDALVAFDPAVTLDGRKDLYLRVTNGAFAGRYIPLATAGITADIGPEQPPAPVMAPVAPDVVAAAVLEGRRQEWDRISQATAGIVNLPARP
jgi:hypothetical protein